MNNQRRVMLGRRGFVLTVAGTFCGVLFSGGGSLFAQIPGIRGIVRNLERDLIEKSRPTRDGSVLCRTEKDRAELYRKCQGEVKPICKMNQMGKFVWDSCNGQNTPREISSLIVRKYAVSHEEAYEDCIRFLSNLKAVGVVSV